MKKMVGRRVLGFAMASVMAMGMGTNGHRCNIRVLGRA